MPPPPESSFKRDEPVGRSAKWIWLAAVSAAVWTAWSAWDMFKEFELTFGTLWTMIGVGIQGTLAWMLFRAARLAWRCRHHRNFDVMAYAVRSQRPFWALLTVGAGLGALHLTVSTIQLTDYNRAIQRWIDEHPPAPPAPVKSPQP